MDAAAPRRPSTVVAPTSRKGERATQARAGYGTLRPWSVIGRSLAVWARNLLPFTLLSLIVNSPFVLFVWFAARDEATAAAQYEKWDTIYSMGNSLLTLLVSGTLSYGVFRQLQGQPARFASCVSVGLSRFFPVLGTSLLSGVYLLVAGIVLAIPIVIVVGILGEAVGLLFALLAGGVGVGLLLAMLFVAIPVAVVESPGVGKALSRSQFLTRGNLWRVFLPIFVILLLNFVVLHVGSGGTYGEGASAALMRQEMIVVTAANVLFLGPIQAVVSAVAYHDLRVAKEDVGIDEIARVFD